MHSKQERSGPVSRVQGKHSPSLYPTSDLQPEIETYVICRQFLISETVLEDWVCLV